MAPGGLVCPGTWRLRTRKGWALSDVIRAHVASVKRGLQGQLEAGLKGKGGHFQWTSEKEEGSDKMPSPYQCILSEPDVLLEGWIHLLFSLFHLLNPDQGLSRAEPWTCVPVEQEAE